MNRRRWLRPRYGLRTLLVLVTLGAALFGWEPYVSQKERRASEAIQRMQGTVAFESIAPTWLERFAGEGYLRRAKTATVFSLTVDEAISYLREFGRLEEVRIVFLNQLFDPKVRDRVSREVDSVQVLPVSCAHADARGLWFARFDVDYPLESPLIQQWAWTVTKDGLAPDAPPSVAWPLSLRHEMTDRRIGMLRGTPTLVRVGQGRYACLYRTDRRMNIAQDSFDEVWFALVDRGHVVDTQELRRECAFDQISLVEEDLNGDGRRDMGVHYWRLSYDYVWHDEFMPKPPIDAKRLKDDPRAWLDAYEITPDGFKLLFEDDEQAANE